MRTLTLLTVALLVVACGAVTPSGSPYAPDDLAFTLPREVRGKSLDVRPLDTAGGEAYRDVVVRVGGEPDDLILATADFEDPEARVSVSAIAMRVRGVGAERLFQALYDLRLAAERSPSPTFTPASIGGRAVLSFPSDGTGTGFAYPKGEVLYLIVAGNPSGDEARADAEAALAALP